MPLPKTFLSLAAGAAFPLLIGCSALLPQRTHAATAPPADPRDVSVAVTKLLEQLHYTRHPLDNEISDRTLHLYLETLDYSHLFFTQKDIAEFEKKYDLTLDEAAASGDLDPAYKIYDRYQKRVEDRVAKVKALLKTEKFTFDGKGSIQMNRQKAPWPKDDAEADQLWHDRIENELLSEGLSEHPLDKPENVVNKRYDRLLRSLHEQTKTDEAKFFINSLALAYDPHSEYFTPEEFDSFSIAMRLSLVGIGAKLQSEDGYAKIVEIMAGSPAEKEGSLKANDKVTAVAQGRDGQFVDTVDMKLDKVVDMIRGKKGTTVRLQVLPAGSTDPSKRKIVAIVREEVKLVDQAAKAEVIEHPLEGGGTEKLGWITLPSFYADMDRRSTDAKSTTKDVHALIDRLNKEGITGLVIDLRKNGGGSLEEAINLTGLFIKRGPVVQAKNSERKVETLSDRDPMIAYAGPLVVLTSHLSASASEIFAGAIQDYGRGVIVGDKNTFGKGTVQTMIEVGKAMNPFGFKTAEAGALKLTIQKFYRPGGGSTQLKGVESDVVLPSRFAHLDIGEDALKYPMPFDEVKRADFEPWNGAHATDLNDLRTRSASRVKTSPEFRYTQEDIDKMESRLASNQISLNLAERKAELADDKKRVADRKAERLARHEAPPVTYALTLADLNKPTLQRVVNDDKKKKKAAASDEQKAADDSEDLDADDALSDGPTASDAVDPVKMESLNILSDLIRQQPAGSPNPAIAVKTGARVGG